MILAPLVSFEEVTKAQANECLQQWEHRMGPLNRGNERGRHFALLYNGEPMAITSTSSLIAPNVGGGLKHLTRANCWELSRLCAERKDLCRVALRLWREFVFPALGKPYVISYQDSDIHSGNTYRFDGWHRAAWVPGTLDRRTDRQGRNRYIWVWPPEGATANVSKEHELPVSASMRPPISTGVSMNNETRREPCWSCGFRYSVIKFRCPNCAARRSP